MDGIIHLQFFKKGLMKMVDFRKLENHISNAKILWQNSAKSANLAGAIYNSIYKEAQKNLNSTLLAFQPITIEHDGKNWKVRKAIFDTDILGEICEEFVEDCTIDGGGISAPEDTLKLISKYESCITISQTFWNDDDYDGDNLIKEYTSINVELPESKVSFRFSSDD